MEVLQLNEANSDACAKRAAQIMREGGVILYPTDTLYGLGADAFSDEAVAKIYAIKGRGEKKPIHGIASDIEMVSRFASVKGAGKALADSFWPGPLTLVFDRSVHASRANTGILRDIATIGFRVPDSAFCIALARTLGQPVTGTSANKSGEVPERSVEKILAQLGASAAEIDLAIDAGELPESMPSTVVDVSGLTPVILREGAIPRTEIETALDEAR